MTATFLDFQQVAFGIARIRVEVLIGSELSGIDENADEDDIASKAGLSNQAEVALVEIAHGGHEAYRVPSRPPGVTPRPDLSFGA